MPTALAAFLNWNQRIEIALLQDVVQPLALWVRRMRFYLTQISGLKSLHDMSSCWLLCRHRIFFSLAQGMNSAQRRIHSRYMSCLQHSRNLIGSVTVDQKSTATGCVEPLGRLIPDAQDRAAGLLILYLTQISGNPLLMCRAAGSWVRRAILF